MRHNSLSQFVHRLATGMLAAALLLPLAVWAEDAKTESSSDEDAIRASVKSYVDAYNRGDAKAVAAHWSDKGQWVSPDGETFTGKEAIETALKSLFKENEGASITVGDPTIRIVSPDVAIEEGTVAVVSPGQLPSESSYLAVHVKNEGKWKLDSVRETEIPDAPARAAELQELAWLVGEWVGDDPEASNEATVVWTKNKTFLNYSFKVSAPGTDDLEGSQVIGWDAAAGVIRSWMFDSDGGFGEGTWSRKGDSWVVKFSQVLPDGRTASATNVYTIIDANVFAWKSIGRNVDGELQPNIEEIKIVRKSALREDTKSAKRDKTAAGSSDSEAETSLSDKPTKKTKGEKAKTQQPKVEKTKNPKAEKTKN